MAGMAGSRLAPGRGAALTVAVAARWAQREAVQGADLSEQQCAARRRQVTGVLAAGFAAGAILAVVTMVTMVTGRG